MRRFLWIGVGIALATGTAAIVWPRDERPVTTRSKQAYELYREGVALLERIEPIPARDKFLAAVQADSAFAMAYARLANSYQMLGWNPEAEVAVAKARHFAPGCSELEQLQITYWSQTIARDREQAKQTLDALIEKYPEDPDVLFHHAVRVYDEAKKNDDRAQFDLAYDLLRKCLAIDPTRVNGHNMLGYVEWERGNFDAAIANLQRYAYYCPGQANPQDSLAEIYFNAGRYEEAVAHYLEALRINPAFGNSALQAAKVLATTGQFAQARQVLDTVKQVYVEMKQEDRLALSYVSVDFEASRWEAVLAGTERYLNYAKAPDPPMTWLPASVCRVRALAQMELGRFADAAASLDARNAYWERMKAERPALFGERDQLEIAMDEMLMRARLWALQGRTQEATDLAKAALEASKLPARSLRLYWYPGIAEVQMRMGALQEAVTTARESLELVPTHPTANRVLGLSLARLGDRDGAQSALAVYLHVMRAADPGNPKVEEARAVYERLRASS